MPRTQGGWATRRADTKHSLSRALNASIDTYKCQHGGPGELTAKSKATFVLSFEYNLTQIHKQVIAGTPYNELLAAELVILEEMVKQNKRLVDMSLVKLYFGMSIDSLLKGQVEEAKIQARAGVVLATYLQYGENLWEMFKEAPEIQKQTLRDMHLGIAQINHDQSLAKLLNAQSPCKCLSEVFPKLGG